jgi:4-amino-4-deoxy-L-arabinose transferase-like glycosyltransferase
MRALGQSDVAWAPAGLILAAVAGAAGIALRVWAYRSPVAAPDSDEAIVGLMARHLLHGEVTTFYWGQPYGGTQEVFLVAPLFAVFGTSLVALRVVPIALVAVACVLVWRVGLRTIGPRAAVAAACVLWLWPPYTIAHTMREYGFYGSNLVYCALLVLLGLRIVERPSLARVGAFGFVLGLAFWQTAQIIPIALPVIAWVAWKAPRALRHAWLGVLLAVVGALPWLIWNVRHDFGSFLTRSDPGSYAHGMRLLASPLVPMLLGLRAPLTAQLLLPKVVVYAIYVGLLALFVYGAWRTWGRRASILYVVASGFVLLWPVSHRVTLLTSHPVYLVVVSPVLALLVAQIGTTWVRAAAVVALVGVVSVVTLHRMNVWFRTDPDHWPPNVPRSFAPLTAALERLGVRHVYANYWIAYKLAFDSREKIIATQYPYLSLVVRDGQLVPSEELSPRYPKWYDEVTREPHAFVVFRHDPMPRRVLAAHGYRRTIVGPFAVYARG